MSNCNIGTKRARYRNLRRKNPQNRKRKGSPKTQPRRKVTSSMSGLRSNRPSENSANAHGRSSYKEKITMTGWLTSTSRLSLGWILLRSTNGPGRFNLAYQTCSQDFLRLKLKPGLRILLAH